MRATEWTAEKARLARDLSGFGLMQVQKARRLADERFDGRLMLALAYLHVSGYAVVRKGTPEAVEGMKVREAESWVSRWASDPAWAELVADDSRDPLVIRVDLPDGESRMLELTHELRERVLDATGWSMADFTLARRLAAHRFDDRILTGMGYVERSRTTGRPGTPSEAEAALVREAEEWAAERMLDPAWTALFADPSPEVQPAAPGGPR